MTIKPRTLNILLVDDRPENLLVLEELLAAEGRRFIRATSGQEALRYVLRGTVGLILLDVQMPDMDGFEVASLIKGNPSTRDIPIIFMTAISKEEKYALQGYVGGAIDYLYKPLNADITRAKIHVFEELFHRQEDLKVANAELIKVNQQLEDLNSQKNYLLGMAAHDLRNPIGAIAQLSQILLSGQVTNEQARFLTAIRESSDYILRIIEDLLDVSKIESGKMSLDIQPTDVRALLSRSLSIHRLIGDKKGIRIELTENLSTAYLYMDAIKIEQVLGNLLSNAIKFSPRGTVILVYAQEQNDQLVISVRDQGPGIPADEQHKLFIGFQTTSIRPTEGEKSTGLGLLICAKIVQAHGGAIHVQSAPGTGSTFWFTIPVTMAERALDGDLPRIRESMPFGRDQEAEALPGVFEPTSDVHPVQRVPRVIAAGKTILVVEDDKVAQLVVKKILGRMGYQAVVTDAAEEALELLDCTDVGMVFMDVHLPGISGIEATRRIRALTDPRKQNVPVVGLTASRAEEEIEECLRAGMNICIKKPVMVAELMKTLEAP